MRFFIPISISEDLSYILLKIWYSECIYGRPYNIKKTFYDHMGGMNLLCTRMCFCHLSWFSQQYKYSCPSRPVTLSDTASLLFQWSYPFLFFFHSGICQNIYIGGAMHYILVWQINITESKGFILCILVSDC